MSKLHTRRSRKTEKKKKQKLAKLGTRSPWPFPFSYDDISGEKQMQESLKKQTLFFASFLGVILIAFWILIFVLPNSEAIMKFLFAGQQ